MMLLLRSLRHSAIALTLAAFFALPAAAAIVVRSNQPETPSSEIVLFAFDQASIPFSKGLRLHLIPGKTPGQPAPIVVGRGRAGEPDDEAVRFYGTVISVGDELRMWYLARSSRDRDTSGQLRVCLATSKDGITWVKPKLGLVEFNGNKDNNIVNIRGGRCELAAIPIILDPEDPDPARRYKMCFESWVYDNKLAVAYSSDGLNWTESPKNPVGPNLEHTGLIRFKGCYYVNGHGGEHFGWTRKMVTHASYDFERWTQASALGFRRDNIPPRPMAAEWNSGEEVHLGAGLWDRGNVIIGIYDMWHGSPSSDRLFVGMDLGLIVSHDALQYQEPVPDFRLVAAFEELIDYTTKPGPGVQAPISPNEYSMKYPLVRAPSLSHGQGMENLGDRTLLWYEVWGVGGVRAVSWPRDQLGCLKVYNRIEERPFRPDPPGQSRTPRKDAHCVTVPVQADSGHARIFLNVGGLTGHCELTVEILDEQFRPVPGYGAQDCAPLREPGLRQAVRWQGRDVVGIKGPFRLKLNFGGVRPEDAELYAIYVTD